MLTPSILKEIPHGGSQFPNSYIIKPEIEISLRRCKDKTKCKTKVTSEMIQGHIFDGMNAIIAEISSGKTTTNAAASSKNILNIYLSDFNSKDCISFSSIVS